MPQAIVALALIALSLSAIVINKTLSAFAECDDLSCRAHLKCVEKPVKHRRSHGLRVGPKSNEKRSSIAPLCLDRHVPCLKFVVQSENGLTAHSRHALLASVVAKMDEIGNVAGVRPKSNCGRLRFRVYSFVRRECCSARPSPLGHYISSQLKRQRTGFSARMNWSPDRPARWRFALFPASRQPTGNVIFGEDVSDRRDDAMSSRRSESFHNSAM